MARLPRSLPAGGGGASTSAEKRRRRSWWSTQRLEWSRRSAALTALSVSLCLSFSFPLYIYTFSLLALLKVVVCLTRRVLRFRRESAPVSTALPHRDPRSPCEMSKLNGSRLAGPGKKATEGTSAELLPD